MTTPGFDPADLDYIETAAQDCLEFVANLSFEQFVAERKTRVAAVWQICVIGEAANRIPVDIQRLAPEINWRQMIGMRNMLIHEFHNIEYAIVWDVSQQDLLPLIASIRHLRARLR